MPYITRERRVEAFDGTPSTSGELNFKLTCHVDEYICETGGVSYSKLNEVIGVLECMKLELYRRIMAPYEDKKLITNGEVYVCASI